MGVILKARGLGNSLQFLSPHFQKPTLIIYKKILPKKKIQYKKKIRLYKKISRKVYFPNIDLQINSRNRLSTPMGNPAISATAFFIT